MNEKNKEMIIVIIFCLVLPIFLLLLSYKAVLFLTPLTAAQEDVFLFLEGKEALGIEFTGLEASHLEDVKKVMQFADYVFYILLLSFTLVLTYYREKRDFVLKLFVYGGKATAGIMIFLGVISLLFFDVIFALFHQLFFPQGNWLFAPDSAIIQTFPLEFFVSISRNIFLFTILLGILFILSGYICRYVLRHRN